MIEHKCGKVLLYQLKFFQSWFLLLFKSFNGHVFWKIHMVSWLEVNLEPFLCSFHLGHLSRFSRASSFVTLSWSPSLLERVMNWWLVFFYPLFQFINRSLDFLFKTFFHWDFEFIKIYFVYLSLNFIKVFSNIIFIYLLIKNLNLRLKLISALIDWSVEFWHVIILFFKWFSKFCILLFLWSFMFFNQLKHSSCRFFNFILDKLIKLEMVYFILHSIVDIPYLVLYILSNILKVHSWLSS